MKITKYQITYALSEISLLVSFLQRSEVEARSGDIFRKQDNFIERTRANVSSYKARRNGRSKVSLLRNNLRRNNLLDSKFVLTQEPCCVTLHKEKIIIFERFSFSTNASGMQKFTQATLIYDVEVKAQLVNYTRVVRGPIGRDTRVYTLLNTRAQCGNLELTLPEVFERKGEKSLFTFQVDRATRETVWVYLHVIDLISYRSR